MTTTLSIVQSLLALAFIAGGAMKLFAYEKYKTMSEEKGPTASSAMPMKVGGHGQDNAEASSRSVAQPVAMFLSVGMSNRLRRDLPRVRG